MMKRSIALLSMLLVVVLAAAFPAAAQDATPAPCTSAELQQTTDLVSSLSDKLSTPMTLPDQPTAEGLTTSLLALNDTYQSFAEIYPNIPACVDGTILKDEAAITLNQEMTVTAITLFNSVHSADKTLDMDITPVLSALWTVESDMATSTAPGIASFLTQLKAGKATPSWLPSCTADQSKFTTQLDDLEKAYTDQIPALQAYLDTGTVDKSAYIAIAQLDTTLITALKNGSVTCAEIYGRSVSDVYLFGETFLALTVGQIAPYLTGSPSADSFNQMAAFYNDGLGSFVGVTTPTETPQ